MVIIALKSQFVSLFITLVSALAELALFAAALALNRYSECRHLRGGHELSVSGHRLRTNVLTVLAMLVFVALEVVTSFFSDPVIVPTPVIAPCMRLDRFTKATGITNDFNRSYALQQDCFTSTTERFQQAGGSLRLSDGLVQCDSTPLISYIIDESQEFSINETVSTCPQPDGLPCMGVLWRPPFFYFTGPYKVSSFQELSASGEKVEALVTRLENFDAAPFYPQITKRLSVLFKDQEGDPVTLRTNAFLGVRRTNCTFLEPGNGAQLPLAVLALIVGLWALSFGSFVATLFLRGKMFYDMSDPMHWATRTIRRHDGPVTADPVVTTEWQEGQPTIYVSSPSRGEEEDATLSRARSLRKRFSMRKGSKLKSPGGDRGGGDEEAADTGVFQA